MRRDMRAALIAALTVALGLTLLGGIAARAQDGTLCALLTPEEVTAALGGEAMIVGEGGTVDLCLYLGREAAFPPRSLTVTHSVATGGSSPSLLDYARQISPDDVEVVVGGFPAIQFGTTIDVFPDPKSQLQFSANASSDVDGAAAVLSLAQLAVSRLGSVGLPTPVPALSVVGDAELVALFPAEVAGKPITVVSYSGADIKSQGGDMAARMDTLLAAHGKTIDDLSVGRVESLDPAVLILAFRVKGADIATLTDELLTLLGGSPSSLEPGQIAGKSVLKAASGVYYPKDDILWSVSAEEPIMTEVLQKLP